MLCDARFAVQRPLFREGIEGAHVLEEMALPAHSPLRRTLWSSNQVVAERERRIAVRRRYALGVLAADRDAGRVVTLRTVDSITSKVPGRPIAWQASKAGCSPGAYRVSWNRMGVDEALLNEVVRRVLTVARPNRIILFGSAVTGQVTEDSDIDLLVVEPDPANTRDRSVKSRRALGDVHYPVDVIAMSTKALRRN